MFIGRLDQWNEVIAFFLGLRQSSSWSIQQRADRFRRTWDIRRELKFIVIDWSHQRC